MYNSNYLNVKEELENIPQAQDSATEMLTFALLSLIWNLAAYVVLLPSVACVPTSLPKVFND